ncbi:CCAAT/enhancer-binding protein zeta [Chionoecetes opilio]|uniref:CCAAT/enhancer-binding protein zeta n=1 Tax=Chionoecetes opilio TaxID=41210 RepID=A0A8J5CZM5_CHIOP|nr:CCAAT/enhancer-binding protein zeta [Chionoecetes opilio]
MPAPAMKQGKKRHRANKTSVTAIKSEVSHEQFEYTTFRPNDFSSGGPLGGPNSQDAALHPCLHLCASLKVESVDLSPLWENYYAHSTILFNGGTKWYSSVAEESKGIPDPTPRPTKATLKDLAGRILQQEVLNYNKAEATGMKGRDVKFRQTVFSHGTSRDKVAAHVLRCMESPVHSLSNLRALVAMVTPKARGTFEEILSSLTELFTTSFLPHGHVAMRFETHSCASLMDKGAEGAHRQLALWYFEDQLAAIYHHLVHQLAEVCKEEVEHNKMRGVRALIELLAANPRQNLTQILQVAANKLGDPARKVAAHAMYCLRTLLQRSPPSRVRCWPRWRSNISTKAQYYGLCFLKDMIFRKGDDKVARELVKLYFGFFKACTKKGEVDTRLMGALLRGLNRAFPYSGLGGAALEEQLGTLYKLCHMVLPGAVQVPPGPLLRFLHGTTAFLNLVYKALSTDTSDPRTLAFFKRLLQVSQYQGPSVACGVLYLVSEVVKERPSLAHTLSALLRTPSTGHGKVEDDLEAFPDVEEVEEDEEEELSDQEETDIKQEDDEDDKNNDITEIKTEGDDIKPASSSSWHHLLNVGGAGGGGGGAHRAHYDPHHRSPLYCGAQYSSLWEFGYLKAHFHPSVSVFATKVLDGKSVEYSGDPLQDFTLIRFLDRFVYRNPKRMSGSGKDSAGGNVLGRRSQYVPQGVKGIAVNTEAFSALDPHQVPEDEVFFHRYFTQFKAGEAGKGVAGEGKGEESDSDESVDDDEFDAFLSHSSGDGGGLAVEDVEEVEEEVDFAAGAKAKDSRKEDDFDDGPPKKKVKGSALDKQGGKKKRRRGGGDEGLGSMFASADTFAHLLEENEGAGDPGSGTSQALANKDRARERQAADMGGGSERKMKAQQWRNKKAGPRRGDAKQLTWEVDRERKMKAQQWRNKKAGPRRGERVVPGRIPTRDIEFTAPRC